MSFAVPVQIPFRGVVQRYYAFLVLASGSPGPRRLRQTPGRSFGGLGGGHYVRHVGAMRPRVSLSHGRVRDLER